MGDAFAHLTDDPIDFRALIASVQGREDGAIVTFAGVVRDHSEGKSVESIHYDAYRSMAEKELAAIVSELGRELPEVRVAVIHRLGRLVVGEASIAIACASPHRAEAFTACREVIERVKKRVPIWKKERTPEGEEWVGWQGGG
ncbi:MAG TPA: molybdenum cofactor biosynthesis protein MoaE [Thermoanaerobaculia bacterium]|nr:molybdenum cofactor biosynthesis protein MoaE [Thermoanaerobaculia bacterium]